MNRRERLAVDYDREVVAIQADQRMPPERVEAYGSEVMAYAHLLGVIYFRDPNHWDLMVEAAQNSVGPHKDSVLEALNIIKQRVDKDPEEFRAWVENELT